MNYFWQIIVPLISFFLGGIPTGKWVAWRVKKVNLQDFGSKNIGTTNAYRALGLKWAVVVFLIDFLKGFLPTILTLYFTKNLNLSLIVGLCCIIGHIFSPYLKFKGGKGVATSIGVWLVLSPYLLLAAIIISGVVLKLTKKMSLASLSGISILFLLVNIFGPSNLRVGIFVTFIMIIFTHRSNIARLMSKNELNI